MSFNDKDFINLLDFYRNQENFHEKSKIPYDNLDNISKSDNENHFIERDDVYMFNFDNLCYNANLSNRRKTKRNLPASMDALYFNEELRKLCFLEFKNLPLKSIDYKNELKMIIDSLKSDYDIDMKIIEKLNDVYVRFEDEIICKLKNKTNESLFFCLPLIYETYCKKSELDFNQCKNDFILWLLNYKKTFIFVFAENDNISPLNKHISFDVKLKDKLKHFDNISNINTIITTKNAFEKDILYKTSDVS